MAKDVVTIYFCGSGNNREQTDKFATPLLHSLTKGERKIIFDGPGGAKIQNSESILKMVESGNNSSSKISNIKFWKSKDGKVEDAWNKMLKNNYGKINAGTGGGTQSNIIVALQWLWMEWHRERFSTVNLCGFSRGAVSCIMLSHLMQAAGFPSLGNIKLNIFTFDPVPGGINDFKDNGKFEQTSRAGTPETLAPMVSSYRSILQENIKKRMALGIINKDKNFKCVVPDYTGTNQGRTPRELYPLPGRHSSSSLFNEDTGTSKLGIHLAQDFLKSKGTEFSGDRTLSPAEQIDAYATARMYWTKGGKVDGAKLKASKHRRPLVTNPFRDHEFYINWHHAALLAQNYPSVTKLVDEGEELDLKNRGTVANALPETYAALKNFGYIT